ncbi:DUF732 domain-containing protein [Mycobacterium sp. CBMA293]|uniref:DUF732 domain-containing protein n=2 Tax=unclassified Mycolicibacterium TaxID=2636767 RepID=UPI0012DE1203|nr:DUF732 domain-containing protein [Mycolicibacterium sp. CBMA 360]MUL57169.1 DUF732 domain-containing protein [Mycolicibacterium sp. CBMA 335]MUL70209.1 DUF732 domain-containing protein [Mycolicibacterium sp. CBMA 311]MUL92257.1 DUF732 domain-containing protein [Mycolicibacterium sp. CBMA 230]MUM04813.1 hypothetical protein [Mycolicibacterium sp. CBMA 213]MUM11113.1 DUF732 domain-containing protein [Mycolicibacterium sp. CBMA 293]
MTNTECPSLVPTLTAVLAAVSAALGAMALAPLAHADTAAYLINVTVRPGYHFANADDALDYGYRLCDNVIPGRTYAAMIGTVKADLQTTDEYQAAYLINQAVNELCPARIPQLRQSAAGYQPAGGAS